MRKLLCTICLWALFLSCLSVSAQSSYRIVNKIKVEGNGAWNDLAVDEINNIIYVSHGNIAKVIEGKTGTVAGIITGTKGIHGIAIANEMNKGFTSNSLDTTVTVFNLKTREIIAKLSIGGFTPSAILYDPFSQKVFTFNEGNNTASVIDAKELRIIGSIQLDGKPGNAVTDNYGKIYVNLEGKNTINVINTMMLQVVTRWEISPCQSPSGLAIDIKNSRLFSVCSNKFLFVIDALNGRIVTKLAVGEACNSVVFDPEYMRIYCANGEGTITVIQEDANNSFRILETITTMPGANTLAIDRTTHHLYLPAAEFISAPSASNPKPGIKPDSFQIIDIETLQ
jgi:DNA-binding beta-propeller fold protein YncE